VLPAAVTGNELVEHWDRVRIEVTAVSAGLVESDKLVTSFPEPDQ
jgi:hypothetical protein